MYPPSHLVHTPRTPGANSLTDSPSPRQLSGTRTSPALNKAITYAAKGAVAREGSRDNMPAKSLAKASAREVAETAVLPLLRVENGQVKRAPRCLCMPPKVPL